MGNGDMTRHFAVICQAPVCTTFAVIHLWDRSAPLAYLDLMLSQMPPLTWAFSARSEGLEPPTF
jgi:hypothetical protein